MPRLNRKPTELIGRHESNTRSLARDELRGARFDQLAPTRMGQLPRGGIKDCATVEMEHHMSQLLLDMKSSAHSRPGASTPDVVSDRALGRYLVLDALGHGGMGIVLEARDSILDRPVAIKLLHPGTADRNATRLMREAQALAKLSHRNVVQVYDAGRVDGEWFIAMELVRGQTLTEWQSQRGWRECVEIYLQAGEGLAAAHAAGLVHRDFKPDNCIVDEHGRAKVLDFGLVREIGAPAEECEVVDEARDLDVSQVSMTRTGTVVGTLGYMPLEQLSGKPVDARSDQFSFCVSLYQALYGERPFTTKAMGRLMLAMMSDDVRPARLGTRVPEEVRGILLRGLLADPKGRWPSMAVLLAKLRGARSILWEIGGTLPIAHDSRTPARTSVRAERLPTDLGGIIQ